ncbi:RNA polymerase sigma factor [Nocardioides jishulii]|uniref:RNA polymerase sigma factor n=1 Tax=Nocardioides jishulii TaxID=2575440 RepID=A0A4V5TKL5_9ACTN|nr:RNA polymerase sigma factor [Nocardioides jishulii]QCX28936.1 RNA polymerase sigma factor [Nocardioides jishulii]TKI64163.1 RNA polymerase sigma factor [Nocardioides jishulii]
MSDDLVLRAQQGDPEAWRVLYRQHAGRLVAWLRTRPTGDSVAAAEDIAAEAWFVAAQKIADFEGSSSDFAGWLFGIARHMSATARRTAERRATTPGDVSDLSDLVGTVAEPQADVAAKEWVRAAISTLPPRERSVIGLVDGLGIDTATAAEILGINAVALRVARHRGLKRLNSSLGERHLTVVRDTPPQAGPGSAAVS